jgi:hypothetical protein
VTLVAFIVPGNRLGLSDTMNCSGKSIAFHVFKLAVGRNVRSGFVMAFKIASPFSIVPGLVGKIERAEALGSR